MKREGEGGFVPGFSEKEIDGILEKAADWGNTFLKVSGEKTDALVKALKSRGYEVVEVDWNSAEFQQSIGQASRYLKQKLNPGGKVCYVLRGDYSDFQQAGHAFLSVSYENRDAVFVLEKLPDDEYGDEKRWKFYDWDKMRPMVQEIE